MIVSKTTQKSFYIKTGRGQYADKYLIMYCEVSRHFDMYKLNTHDLVPICATILKRRQERFSGQVALGK